MGRYRKKTDNRLPPFVALTWDMLNSMAYKELPHSAGKALPYFLGKVKVGYNSPERHSTTFSLSYSEAKKHGFSNSTHHKIISELIEKGFVDPVSKGGLRGAGRTVSRFMLSERWKKYGSGDFEHADSWKEFYQGKK